MTNSCQVALNVNKIRTRLQSEFNLPESVANRLNSTSVATAYRRCKSANSFPPMKMKKSGNYMYYIDPKSVLTPDNYEKLISKGTYIADLRRIAAKIGLYDGETKKEHIRSNIFEFLQKSGIAEPIRFKISSSSKNISNSNMNMPPNNSSSNMNVPPNNSSSNMNVPPNNSSSNMNVPQTNNSSSNMNVPRTNNSSSNMNAPRANMNVPPPSNNYQRPNFKPNFRNNTPFRAGYQTAVPRPFRIRRRLNAYNPSFNFGYNANTNNNAKIAQNIRNAYRMNGVTNENLFRHFKRRNARDQLNLEMFMKKYIPNSMRKKQQTMPSSSVSNYVASEKPTVHINPKVNAPKVNAPKVNAPKVNASSSSPNNAQQKILNQLKELRTKITG